MNGKIEVIEADLGRADHAKDILALTAAYALDPMGNGGALPASVLDQLIEKLRSHPTTKVFLMYSAGSAVGIATCFLGFSTFRARPLLNVHDFAILSEHRGKGLARQLLDAVEARARELGCCKVTLEVQENNVRARRVYERSGLRQAVYGDSTGGTLSLCKGSLNGVPILGAQQGLHDVRRRTRLMADVCAGHGTKLERCKSSYQVGAEPKVSERARASP